MEIFDGAALIAEEYEKQLEFVNNINNVYNNINDNLSTNLCEYVDNYKNIYINSGNSTQDLYLKGFENINNIFDTLQKYYNNISKSTENALNYKGFSGYVEKIVDNVVNNEDNLKVIHNTYGFSENLSSEGENIFQNFDSFYDSVKNLSNVENNSNSESNNFTINFGGVTQNITGSNGDDVMEILADKLREAICGFGDRIY